MLDEDVLRTRLRDRGVRGEIRALAEDAPTAALTAAQLGCTVSGIVNSLVFTADGSPLLVLVSGAHRVDLTRVRTLLGSGKVRRATPDQVAEATGQVVGGVGPIGHPERLRTLIDITLDGTGPLWAGAGLPHVVFRTTFTELRQLTGATPAELHQLH